MFFRANDTSPSDPPPPSVRAHDGGLLAAVELLSYSPEAVHPMSLSLPLQSSPLPLPVHAHGINYLPSQISQTCPAAQTMPSQASLPCPPIQPLPVPRGDIGVPDDIIFELVDALTDEERRAKHRLVQRRFMSRKKAEIQRVRQEASRLEKRYGYLRTFKDLNALKKENEELKRRSAVMPVQELSFETVDRILQAESETMRRYFEPFAPEDVKFMMEETHTCVETNLSGASFVGEPISKFQGLGWSGQRVLHTKRESDATLSVEVSKTFLRDSAQSLVDRAWAVISSPDGYRKLFCPHLRMKVTMLQRVNDDCVVVHRVLFNEKSGDIVRSVDLLCRVQRADKTSIISRALPVQKLRGIVNDPAGWCSSINVLSFAPIVHERSNIAKTLEESAKRAGCDFTYRGFVRRQVDMPLKVWALEIILMMMRLETMIVAPPVVIKTSK